MPRLRAPKVHRANTCCKNKVIGKHRRFYHVKTSFLSNIFYTMFSSDLSRSEILKRGDTASAYKRLIFADM